MGDCSTPSGCFSLLIRLVLARDMMKAYSNMTDPLPFPPGFRTGIPRKGKPPGKPLFGPPDGLLVAGVRLELTTFGL